MFPRLPVYFLISLPVFLVFHPACLPPLVTPAELLVCTCTRPSALTPAVNTVFSPLLVASSLGALGGGSAGTTSSQLKYLLKTSTPAKAGAEDLLSEALKSFTKANASSSSQLGICEREPGQVYAAASASGKGDSKADLKQLHGWAKADMGGPEGAPLVDQIQTKPGALILANALRFKVDSSWWTQQIKDDSGAYH
ncbi:hypothetical protein NQZ68_017876 [Dissostichus eleginoides]|nr:hypothetical protein NQZ68_017876 [Dissostichus eleginoides]